MPAAGYAADLLARIQAEGDTFYRGHEGGFEAGDIVAVADRLDALDGGRFAGITTFPALLFDPETRKVRRRQTSRRWTGPPRRWPVPGGADIEINAPGTTSTAVLAALAEAGATQMRAGQRLARHDCAACRRRPAGAPGSALPDRGLAPRRRQGLLLRRRLLHRPDLPATTT